MIVDAWRITKSKYSAQAFSGKPASYYGGRWNSPGTRVIYTSSSASLALLEVLVHLGQPGLLPAYSLIPATFDDILLVEFNLKYLPADWQSHPPPLSTRSIGDQWVANGRSCVLAVPSVVVPGEINYLINPEHPDFGKIDIGDPMDFPMDPRLLDL